MLLQTIQLINKSFLQRLFRQEPADNAIIELNNLLANKYLLLIGKEDVRAIETRYQLSLSEVYPLNLQEFYAVHWNYYISRNTPEQAVTEKMTHLANILSLNDQQVAFLQIETGKKLYETSATKHLEKGHLTDIDERELDHYGKRLKLPKNEAAFIQSRVKAAVYDRFIQTILKKERCSAAELDATNKLIADLGLDPEQTRSGLDRLKKLNEYWQLENLPLQPITATSSVLQKAETCYLQIRKAQWHELRSAGRGYQHLELINDGTLWLTNKRLIFEGRDKNSVLPYDRILGVKRDGNCLQIRKDKGKEPVIKFSGDTQVLEIVLQRLLQDN